VDEPERDTTKRVNLAATIDGCANVDIEGDEGRNASFSVVHGFERFVRIARFESSFQSLEGTPSYVHVATTSV
jgi:hypothetical protein